jgi:GntR family transcriptional regulator
MSTLRLPPAARSGPSLPLHERVAAAVRRAIVEGEFVPGRRLPTARSVAEGFGIHPNTVLRAYRALRDEGLIELRAGRGATVVAAPPRPPDQVEEQMSDLLRVAARHGLQPDDVIELIRRRSTR